MSVDVVLAFDIGASNSRSMVSEVVTGRELVRATDQTNRGDYRDTLCRLKHTTMELVGTHRLVSVAAALASPLDKEGVVTDNPSNLPGFASRAFKADLENQYGVPVATKNDCEAAALGEFTAWRCSLTYVGWGTGVGVAVAEESDGGVKTRRTELGHMTIDQSSQLQCGCGGYGHLEGHVGGTNLPQRFGGQTARWLTDNQWGAVLLDLAVGLRNLSAGDMEFPIVLGGGVTNKQAHRLPTLQSMVDRLPSTCPSPQLRLAHWGEDSALVGMTYAAQQIALPSLH